MDTVLKHITLAGERKRAAFNMYRTEASRHGTRVAGVVATAPPPTVQNQYAPPLQRRLGVCRLDAAADPKARDDRKIVSENQIRQRRTVRISRRAAAAAVGCCARRVPTAPSVRAVRQGSANF